MGADTLTEILGKYGIGAMVVVVLCIISYAIIKHILKQSDKILESAMQANEKWQKVIDEHTSQAREFHNTQTEANRYVREEHNKMSDCLDKIKNNLEAQGKTLAKLNGN